MGKIADNAATAYTAALPPVKKGPLGETMGRIRSVADGRPREPGKPKSQPATINPKGPKWYPDGLHIDPWSSNNPLWHEDKFGWDPTVSPNQRLAEAMLQSNFQLNHFLPVDVGLVASAPAAAVGLQANERLNQRRR